MKYLLVLLWTLVNLVHAAEFIPITPIETCFNCNSEPTKTMYWQGKDSKAVLILIPGGEGYVGIKPTYTDMTFHQFQTLKRLTNPNLTSGHFDFVLLDSPAPLSPNQRYPAARGEFDHLIRIESAIKYYKEKTGLPVWLMGHSNGGISLTEFIKYAQKNGKLDLISGVVASAIRSESYFNTPIPFPMLFLHHKLDGCGATLPSASYSNYLKVKEFITAPINYVYVTTGEAEAKDPCRSGFHMYFGAGEEVAKDIDEFMTQYYK